MAAYYLVKPVVPVFCCFWGMVWCGNGRFMIAFPLEMYDLQMMSNEAARYK